MFYISVIKDITFCLAKNFKFSIPYFKKYQYHKYASYNTTKVVAIFSLFLDTTIITVFSN